MYVFYSGKITISEEDERRWRLPGEWGTSLMKETWEVVGELLPPTTGTKAFHIPARETAGTRDILAVVIERPRPEDGVIFPLLHAALSTAARFEFGYATKVEFWFEGLGPERNLLVIRIGEIEEWEARSEGRSPNLYQVEDASPHTWLKAKKGREKTNEDSPLPEGLS